MGKGRRKRKQQQNPRPFEVLYKKAEKQQKGAGGLAIAALVIMAFLFVLPLWSISVMAQNLAAAQYDAEETAILTPLLPIGRLAFGLIAVGALLCAVLLWCRRAKLSSLGLALCAVGEGFLIYFTVLLGQVFAYDLLEQRGLTFGDLLMRYYVLLVPFCLLVVAVVRGLAAQKKRMIASMMETASDTAPTVLLDEE